MVELGRSNVTIAPNIYVRTSVNVQNDDEFVKRVSGHKALNILRSRLTRAHTTKLTRAQIEEMKRNVICRHGKTREHAYGKALMEDGKIVWSCRCEHTNCHAYEKCMNLPNAVKITRGTLLESENEMLADMDVESIGDDVFEPPYPPVAEPVLPALNDIKYEWEQPQAEQPWAEQMQVEQPWAEQPVTATLGATQQGQETIEFTAEKQGGVAKIEPVTEELPTIFAETFCPAPDKRVLVICETPSEVGYFSTLLYKNKIKHRLLRPEGYTLSRKIADVFWDYCAQTIDKEAFFDRCLVRLGLFDETELSDFYEALFKMCGDKTIGESGGLNVFSLVDALNDSPELISECVLNMDVPDVPVTVSTLKSLTVEDEYDEVYLLEGGKTGTMLTATENLFGSTPLLIQKENVTDWLLNRSSLGRAYRISMNNYNGACRCLNVELGLWGDIDAKSFICDHIGDSLRLQLYIAEKIQEGDELTIEKNTDEGGYWFYHNGNILGEVPDLIIREIRAIEGFPEDFSGFEGVFVRNIVTCISEKDDSSLPERFKDSRLWLGLDVTGYAKVLI